MAFNYDKFSPKVLGLDPGLVATGYSIVKSSKYLAYGVIKPDPQKDWIFRIAEIVSRLKKIIRTYRPEVCVVETLFFRKVSARSVITSAHLRGAILYLLFSEKIPLVEITPAKIKKAVTGNGRASKAQIAYMVRHLYNINENLNHHTSDALAIAYTYLVAPNNFTTNFKYIKP
ncbi:MAG: crossover junction endodeoxyribonuclease RuvC [candidate division WOR-3 bacterium]